jgi:DNA-directed RNA polymerase subunit beta'
VIVREDDCGTNEGVVVDMSKRDDKTYMTNKLLGRVPVREIASKSAKKVYVKKDEEIDYEKLAQILKDDSIERIVVRSPLYCRLKYGICAACYGWDLSAYHRASMGTPVGVVAAQSIGEPGTQLTMRVKHFGGVVMSDVTQGLPRVEELFEVRRPKNLAPVAEITGKVQVSKVEDGYIIRVRNTKVKPAEEREYFVPLTSNILVEEGQQVVVGTQLCEGYLDPKDVLKVSGLLAAQEYLISEVQKVYESQGISIHYKHLEAIKGKVVSITGKANEKGNLFKAIHKKEILEAMQAEHHAEISEEFITLEKPIKEVGEFIIPVEIKGKKSSFTLMVKTL